MNKAEREKIAKSLLTGNYEISNSGGGGGGGTAVQHQYTHSHHGNTHTRIPPIQDPIGRTQGITKTKERLLYMQRHNLPKQHFLEIMTETATIPVVTGKELFEQKRQMLKKKGLEDTWTHVKLSPGLTWEDAIKGDASKQQVRENYLCALLVLSLLSLSLSLSLSLFLSTATTVSLSNHTSNSQSYRN
jgi:hypothetical protein